MRDRIVDGLKACAGPLVVDPALRRERALRDLRQYHPGVEDGRGVRGEAEPFQRGKSDDHCLVSELLALAQARLDVAAQRPEEEVGPRGGELGPTTDGAGTDARARHQLLERATDEC